MSSLGDAFPDDLRENFANENLKVGAVIKVAVPDTTPPKIKILIVVGIESGKALLATVFVNTDINPNVLNTPELQKLQFALKLDNCPYLSYDSFADCSKMRERNYQDIFNLIKESPSRHLGRLNDDDLKRILALIKSAK